MRGLELQYATLKQVVQGLTEKFNEARDERREMHEENKGILKEFGKRLGGLERWHWKLVGATSVITGGAFFVLEVLAKVWFK